MDHGAEFGAYRRDENGQWDSEFKQHIVNLGIKSILACVKYPQTNGKIEKWYNNWRKLQPEAVFGIGNRLFGFRTLHEISLLWLMN